MNSKVSAKESALDYIRSRSSVLAHQLKDFDEDTVVRLQSVLKPPTYYRVGRSMEGLLSESIESKALTQASLRVIAPHLEAFAKSGNDPVYLAKPLLRGLKSKAITSEDLPQSAERIRSVLEVTGEARQVPNELGEVLSKHLGSGLITHRELALIAPHLEAAAKAGYRPSDLLALLTSGLKSKAITSEDLSQSAKRILSALEATAKAGQPTLPLFATLYAGLESNAITAKTLPQSIGHLRSVVDAPGKKPVNPWLSELRPLDKALMGGFKSGAITHRELALIAPSLEATAKAGHDPTHLLSLLTSSFGLGVITHEDLPPSAEHMRSVVEATATAGQEPSKLVSQLIQGLKSKAIPQDSLPVYANLLNAAGRGWSHSEILKHSIEAHKLGIPAEKIPGYQMELVKRKHFPNAGLVKELHEIKMKGTRKK